MLTSAPRAASPYERVLGSGFVTLDPDVRRAHLAPLVAAGTLDVEHGVHWFVPALVRILTLPVAGRGQRVHLEVTASGGELLWTRKIGRVALRTRQHAHGSSIVERVGIGAIVFEVAAESGALVYRQQAFCIAGVPLPRFLAPRVDARVASRPGGWHVDVRVAWRGHLVCRYAGDMVPA